jgi:uncharacterized protein (DUF362 family)
MKVALYRSSATSYVESPPYHPPVLYPELAANGFKETLEGNDVYDAVRSALHLYFGESDDPLRNVVRPGDRIVVKPNLVSHEHGVQVGQRCLTTHGAVVRAMVDYAFIAGGRDAQIVIADAPVQGADFDKLTAQNGLDEIREFYWKTFRYELRVIDLRQVRAVLDEQSALIRRVEELPGDPHGYSVIDLGEASRLRPLDAAAPRYAVGDYDQEATNRRHRGTHHEYVIANTILDADVILNVPKLKTHSKVGLTMALKNMVGTVGSKDCLPHHRHGLEGRGGDEFPADYPRKWLLAMRGGSAFQGKLPPWLWRMLRKGASTMLRAGTPARETPAEPQGERRFFPSGSWYGNDTIWRTVDDLNRILFFWSRRTNAFESTPQRRYFAVIDGIVSMEGNGPLKGSPRPTGVVLAGDDPLALDVTAASLAGFDWTHLNMLAGMAGQVRYSAFTGDLDAIEIISNDASWRSVRELTGKAPHLPPAGWRNHVETEG